MHILIFSWIGFSFLQTNCLLDGAEFIHHVVISDPVYLYCNGTRQLNNKWKYEEILIYFNNEFLDQFFKETLLAYQNDSLLIQSSLLNHEGLYACFRDSIITVKHFLKVKGLVYSLYSSLFVLFYFALQQILFNLDISERNLFQVIHNLVYSKLPVTIIVHTL